MVDTRFDVTSIGELLLRLSVPTGKRLETATNFDVHPAGAEANVITLLARLERRTCWFGALPKNSLGQLAANALRVASVETSGIIWRQQGRIGLYFVEFGAPPRGIQVTYDRAYSCATQIDKSEIDWDKLLDTRLLHLTGIMPALSPSCYEILQAALTRAKERGVPVSFDVNYRQKLWSETEAEKVLAPLIREVEILFCSRNDACRIFQCKGSAQEVASQLLDRSQARYVVLTDGDQGALLWNGEEWRQEPSRTIQIVDRLGAGDALAAGVIHGWLGDNIALGLRYGVTLSALALSQDGDTVITNKEELLRLSNSDSTLTR